MWIAVVVAVAGIAGLVTVFVDAIPGTLRRTADGLWGTGTYEWPYPDGKPMRIDEVYRGRETRSRWFDRQGTLVGETTWVDGTGIAYFLRTDGTIKRKVTCKEALAHGTSWYFATDGTLQGTAEFREGQYQSGFQPQAGNEAQSPSVVESPR